jgi:nucleoside-diphosphate-sugar epimerase
MRLMIFGAGFSGLAIARALAGDCAFVGGTTRSEVRFADLRVAGVTPFLYDGGEPAGALLDELRRTTHLVMSIAPDTAGDPLLAAFAGGLKQAMPALEWIGYLSTVGVYGDHDGDWVDEETICRPVSKRSVARRAAESGWSGLADQAGIPLALIRLSGIYGPGRNALKTLDSGKARRLIKPGQVFNRIHVADIAGAVALLARNQAWRNIQRHRRPARASAGRRHLCGQGDGSDATTRDGFRDSRPVSNGAIVLRGKQARLQCANQDRRLPVRLSGLLDRPRRALAEWGLEWLNVMHRNMMQ